MSVLAHVFEAAGIATVVLSSVREMVVKVGPPRALHCEFPLGRPLGRPNDPDFQHDVLARAFSLLDEPTGPVLVDHPTVIEAVEEQVLACTLPPRFDPTLLPAVDEARGLRKAYERARERRGVTSVGRAVDAEGIPAALEALAAIGATPAGGDWTAVDVPGGSPTAVALDIRTYYEEAAGELATGAQAGPRAIDAWFFEQTEAGAVVLAARRVIRDSGADRLMWFGMAPSGR